MALASVAPLSSLLVLLVCVGLLPKYSAGRCHPGWLEGTSACYTSSAVSPSKKWADAELDCQSLGPNGHLATFNTHDDMVLISPHVTNHWPFMGLRDLDSAGWFWTSGDPYGGYMRWSTGRPQGNGTCGGLCQPVDGVFRWCDEDCQDSKRYFCQYDPTPTPLATSTVRSKVDCAVQCASNSLCTSFTFNEGSMTCEMINEGPPLQPVNTVFHTAVFKNENSTYMMQFP